MFEQLAEIWETGGMWRLYSNIALAIIILVLAFRGPKEKK